MLIYTEKPMTSPGYAFGRIDLEVSNSEIALGLRAINVLATLGMFGRIDVTGLDEDTTGIIDFITRNGHELCLKVGNSTGLMDAYQEPGGTTFWLEDQQGGVYFTIRDPNPGVSYVQLKAQNRS
jgi:hypothetical protein